MSTEQKTEETKAEEAKAEEAKAETKVETKPEAKTEEFSFEEKAKVEEKVEETKVETKVEETKKEELLLGKFKSADELGSSYLDLQKELSAAREEAKKRAEEEKSILGEKFKSSKDLAKSYFELEKKFSTLTAKPGSEEELKKQISHFFSEVKDKELITDAEMRKVADDLHSQTGIPKMYVDKIASVFTNNTFGAKIERQKAEAVSLLKEGDNKDLVAAALEKDEAREDFQKRVNSGDVTVNEIKALTRIGKDLKVKESNTTFDFGLEDKKSTQSLAEEYNTIVRNPAYHIASRPEHNKLVQRAELLKKQLGW